MLKKGKTLIWAVCLIVSFIVVIFFIWNGDKKDPKVQEKPSGQNTVTENTVNVDEQTSDDVTAEGDDEVKVLPETISDKPEVEFTDIPDVDGGSTEDTVMIEDNQDVEIEGGPADPNKLYIENIEVLSDYFSLAEIERIEATLQKNLSTIDDKEMILVRDTFLYKDDVCSFSMSADGQKIDVTIGKHPENIDPIKVKVSYYEKNPNKK